ncbi:MAG: sugar phosphate isomerase/epimerase family protein [Eubacteriales bacterium]|nr:sugar phosphate isomerase/epimerase family protein [Eubacteriales bacterium]
MKLSTTTLFYGPRPDGSVAPMMDSIRRISKAGFEDLDLNFAWTRRHRTELYFDNWKEWTNQCGELINELGMTVSQTHAPFYNVIDSGYPYREEEEEMVRRSIIASAELGAKTVVIHGGSIPYCPNYKTNKEKNMEYFKPHLELAAKYGVNIAIENLFDENNLEKRVRVPRYLSHPEDLIDLVDSLHEQYENVGIIWDFGHANLMNWNQPECLEMIGDRLIATHVQDNYGVIDDHLLPYLGNTDWESIMKTLKKINYQGAFAFETHKMTDRLPDPMIDAMMKYAYELGVYLLSLAK